MKKLVVVIALLSTPVVSAQVTSDQVLRERVQQLEDRTALRTLVDTFSILADRKDVAAQMLLFTEDATVESISGGQRGSLFKGRKEIGDAFSAYLANFQTVYHMNGQHTVTLQGDRATGTYYCLVVLIGVEDGKTIKNTSGVFYNDEYVRRDGKWLISKRVSHFAWRDRQEMPQPTARAR